MAPALNTQKTFSRHSEKISEILLLFSFIDIIGIVINHQKYCFMRKKYLGELTMRKIIGISTAILCISFLLASCGKRPHGLGDCRDRYLKVTNKTNETISVFEEKYDEILGRKIYYWDLLGEINSGDTATFKKNQDCDLFEQECSFKYAYKKASSSAEIDVMKTFHICNGGEWIIE